MRAMMEETVGGLECMVWVGSCQLTCVPWTIDEFTRAAGARNAAHGFRGVSPKG